MVRKEGCLLIIAVSGNVGSGKSTLAEYISLEYGFEYIPVDKLYQPFLDDFFTDIPNLFLPTQLSFLLSKAIDIYNLNKVGKNIVVDRSLLEDISIFARLWMENYNIEARSRDLYMQFANFIIEQVPRPDFYFVCLCSPETSHKRISERKSRSYEGKYPINHIEQLAEYYNKLEYLDSIATVFIESEKIDFNNKSQLTSLLDCLFKIINEKNSVRQISLFDSTLVTDNEDDNFQKNNFFRIQYNQNEYNIIIPVKLQRAKPYIYFAAPFTSLATEEHAQIQEIDELHFNQFLSKPAYGTIPHKYRESLLRITKAIRKNVGMPVILPHRDINSWGEKSYTASFVLRKIKENVENASALVAIPGQSIGVHLEIGISLSKRIPILIFDIKDIAPSFYMEGFSELDNVRVCEISSIDEAEKILKDPEIIFFLRKGQQQYL